MSSAPAESSASAVLASQFVNPFIAAVRQVFEMMMGCEARRKSLKLDSPERRRTSDQHEISSVIGITGRATGTMVLKLGRDVACNVHESLLGHREETITPEVADAVGELTNMIAGAAKAKLASLNLSISVPNIVSGAGHEIWFPSDLQILVLEFGSEIGDFTLEVGFSNLSNLS